MSNAPTIVDTLSPETMERALISGNLKSLTPGERLNYYSNLCKSLGLNPLSRPFDYIEFQGRLALYANKGCAEQLRSVRKVSLTITGREAIGDVYVVTARAKLPDGREDESTGAVPIAGLKGDALANAYLKAETKAKRRVTLSICGLNMLDETEVETIRDARKVDPKEVESQYEAYAQNFQDPREMPYDAPTEADPADYVIQVKKESLNGRRLGDVAPEEIANYLAWCERWARENKKALSHQVVELKVNFERLYADHEVA